MTRKKAARNNTSAKKTPACPECGSAYVVPVLHGLITPSLQRAIDKGHAVRADREEWEGLTEWYCKACGCDWSAHSRRFKKAGGVNATRSD